MKKCVYLLAALLLLYTPLAAQTPSGDSLSHLAGPQGQPLRLHLPQQPGWTSVQEGKTLRFRLHASGGADTAYVFTVMPAGIQGLQFDSLGHFTWTPGYDAVSRLRPDSTYQLLFEVRNRQQERVHQVVELQVQHANRPPQVGELKPFYVRYNQQNIYTIEQSALMDADGDPLVIVPNLEVMPEGAKLSPQGEFSWKPSLTQFNQLRNRPLQLEFWLEDQPAKARTKGSFRIEVTQQDLPPSIQMIPSQNRFRYSEDATINLKFQLYDPNGESDIASFSMLSDNTQVPAAALVKNTPSQWEFIWKPGYDFVKDPLDSLSFHITFFVLDKANKQDERRVYFTILNAVNEAEQDRKLYEDYRAAMVRAWDLMEQLTEAEEDLKKRYRKAKRGKKARSLTNASLGAATGITPVVVEEPGTSKKITAIGGTAVMTIGTLEATEVIGRSTKDLVERLNYIMEKRNELQTKGDIFARKYALKSARRKPEFMKEMDDFIGVMNLRGLVALELDAGWKNKKKPTSENVARTFKDFAGEKQ
ncbi:hypothetical protein [Cesiribacter andamanensis]|uniref:Uncharacterized protein n=1 Tax=Cesiribacter andamanensis AMV16 TaxID=1279009 RepID=M7MXD5_9BACT|nr:hypothetical protein [Cesiribacter andamanensis]EMR01103.1 hypothetical protein ADICEAN_03774 [Cesiribacter andamanensis AMV16]